MERFFPQNAFMVAVTVTTLVFILFTVEIFRIISTRIVFLDENLEYKVGLKTQIFNLEECQFSSQSDNFGTKDLFVWREGRKVATLECEMLSEADFEDLLKNLGVIGQKAKAVDLKIKKK